SRRHNPARFRERSLVPLEVHAWVWQFLLAPVVRARHPGDAQLSAPSYPAPSRTQALLPAGRYSRFAPPPVATYSYARRGGCRASVLASPRKTVTIEIASEVAARRPELARNAALGYAPGSWRIRRGVVLRGRSAKCEVAPWPWPSKSANATFSATTART